MSCLHIMKLTAMFLKKQIVYMYKFLFIYVFINSTKKHESDWKTLRMSEEGLLLPFVLVHSLLCTQYALGQGTGRLLRKDDSSDNTLAIYMNYFTMTVQCTQQYSRVDRFLKKKIGHSACCANLFSLKCCLLTWRSASENFDCYPKF